MKPSVPAVPDLLGLAAVSTFNAYRLQAPICKHAMKYTLLQPYSLTADLCPIS